jgi:alkanesulfonate monooxygenase SsuD/methylene tetrahydromethanopterin reductase-like flavin-dependent oxidoreductase (luciferase family)
MLREPLANVAGAHYSLHDAVAEPKPRGPLPLLLGVRQDRALRLVARHADEWNMWAVPEMLRERDIVLRRHCDELGRERSSIRTSVQVMVLVTDDEAEAEAFREQYGRRRSFAGHASALADFVAECGEAGADEFVVPDQGLGTGQRRLDAMDAIRAAIA